jgi:hypothetical protein
MKLRQNRKAEKQLSSQIPVVEHNPVFSVDLNVLPSAASLLSVNDGITTLESGPFTEHPQPELPECDLNRSSRPDDDIILQGMPSSSDHSIAKHSMRYIRIALLKKKQIMIIC